MTPEDAFNLGKAVGLIEAAIAVLQALSVALALLCAWGAWSWYRSRWR